MSCKVKIHSQTLYSSVAINFTHFSYFTRIVLNTIFDTNERHGSSSNTPPPTAPSKSLLYSFISIDIREFTPFRKPFSVAFYILLRNRWRCDRFCCHRQHCCCCCHCRLFKLIVLVTQYKIYINTAQERNLCLIFPFLFSRDFVRQLKPNGLNTTNFTFID